MFRNLKCKNTVLCELSVVFIPLLIIIAGTIASILIPDEAVASVVMVISLIVALIPIAKNMVHIFSLDVTLTSLRNWQKDRLSYETDINGITANEVEKAITERALSWGETTENQNGAVLTRYKKTKTHNEVSKVVHQNLIVYSMQTLTFDDYRAKLDEAKNSAVLPSINEDTEGAVAVMFISDRVEQAVINSVRADYDGIEDKIAVILPIVYDGLSRQYYLNSLYEATIFVKPTKNYLLNSIKKIVFGGRFPLENNDRYDYSNEISIWQDKTLGELIDDIKEEQKKEKQFIKNTAEQLTDGQTLFCDETLYIKHNGKLVSYDVCPNEENPNEVLLWTMGSWDYPLESEISKKDKAVLEQIATDYFKSQNKKAVFDIEE